jgi:biopolymer transport protein ExbD
VRTSTPAKLAEAPAVDVTPIMNMFIILLPFLISMAVFSHLTVLQFSLPADGGPGRAVADAEIPLTVAMTESEIAITRGELILATIAATELGYDFPQLIVSLQNFSADYSVAEGVVVAVDDGVVFDDVVHCMDTCRQAGFSDIGLAAGTNLDRGGSDANDLN